MRLVFLFANLHVTLKVVYNNEFRLIFDCFCRKKIIEEKKTNTKIKIKNILTFYKILLFNTS